MSESRQTELTDFPDILSPVLVKELRQGLRTNLFVTAFILLQGFMILCLLMFDGGGGGSAANGVFWFFICVTFFGIQPLRGFSSLSSEFNFNTMDMIQLTNLNALRIAFGKWCALNAQSLLLFVTVIPYMVLRYFFGSVDLVGDLKLLAGTVFCSGVLSAITVGCSSFKGFLTRLLLLIVTITLFSVVASMFAYMISGFIEVLAFVFSGIIIGAYFIFFGASKIAPQSENHSTRKRLLGFVGALGICGLSFVGLDKELALLLCAVITVLTIIDAVTEDLPVFHGVLPRFKGNFFMRQLAGVFTPGWHTGIVFSMIACLPMLVVFYHKSPKNVEGLMRSGSFALLLLATLVFPLLFIHMFFRKSSLSKIALYIAIQACVAALVFLAAAVSSAMSYELREIIFLILPLPGVLLFSDGLIEPELSIPIAGAWLVLSAIILFVASRRPFKEMRRYFKAVRQEERQLIE